MIHPNDVLVSRMLDIGPVTAHRLFDTSGMVNCRHLDAVKDAKEIAFIVFGDRRMLSPYGIQYPLFERQRGDV